MEEVLGSGTGAGIRSRGLTLPAASTAGTSRDGWFTGSTDELLRVVWVGFDDNHNLDLEGAQSGSVANSCGVAGVMPPPFPASTHGASR
jgi:penicillin-binding protein 1B